MHLNILLVLSLITSCIELEISAPSFLDIANSLSISETMVGLTITYNLIGFCLGSVIYGPLSEIYGRRRIMIVGNAILAIGSIFCVITPNIEFLLSARFIQGLGAATSAVVTSAIIADVYHSEKAARLYGFMNAIFTTLMALSPVFGGFINHAIGWRGNYGFVALICITSWTSLYFYLPETKPEKEKLHLKKILHDYHTLLTSRIFLCAASSPSIPYSCYITFVAIAPFLYMKSFGLDILTYTLHQGAIVAVFAAISVFTGKIIHMIGAQKTVILALILIMGGSGLMLFASSPYELTITMCIASIGAAIQYPIIFAKSVQIFPRMKGTSSSAIMSLRYLICSIVTGTASFLYDGTPVMLARVILSANTITLILTIYLLRNLEFGREHEQKTNH